MKMLVGVHVMCLRFFWIFPFQLFVFVLVYCLWIFFLSQIQIKSEKLYSLECIDVTKISLPLVCQGRSRICYHQMIFPFELDCVITSELDQFDIFSTTWKEGKSHQTDIVNVSDVLRHLILWLGNKNSVNPK